MNKNKTAVVMGGGIQGVCSALALAQIGFKVHIVDKQPELMQMASLRNEGKIHLGFVYANDKSFETASLMCRGALAFAPIIESLIGAEINWNDLKSNYFDYSILESSLLSKEELIQHYIYLNAYYKESLRLDPKLHYFGLRDENIYLGEDESLKNINAAISNVATTEIALDLVKFKSILCAKIHAHSSIFFTPNTQIVGVSKLSDKFKVEAMENLQSVYFESDIVVNCLWDARLAIDATMGIYENRDYMYRLKYRLLGNIDSRFKSIPSQTFALGAYGDFVNYQNGQVYVSWYPVCMAGATKEMTVPEHWKNPCTGVVDSSIQKELKQRVKDEFGSILPLVKEIEFTQIDAGVIFSYGKTDIEDRQSELHKRYEIGVKNFDGYYSVDTGKFTTAPLFAKQLQQIVLGKATSNSSNTPLSV